MSIATRRLSAFLIALFVSYESVGAERSQSVRRAFIKEHPCPIVVDGKCRAEVDHAEPICAGGKDEVSNLQWLEIEQHRRKTAMDILRCARLRALKARQ